MDIFSKAVGKLTDKAWRLDGETPTTEAEFLAQFKVSVGHDETGSQVYSSDPADFGFAWEELQQLMHTETFNIAKSDAFETVQKEHAVKLREFTGSPTIEERDTWTVQLKAAETYLINGNGDDKAFLEGLLTDAEVSAIDANGADKATQMANKIIGKATQMANKIIGKAARTKTLIKMAGKMKREAEQAIESATTVDELEATLESLKAQEHVAVESFETMMRS